MAKSSNKLRISSESTINKYDQLADIIARYTTDSGEDRTAISGLILSKKETPSRPLYLAQWPCIAMVIQGAKSVTLGQDVF